MDAIKGVKGVGSVQEFGSDYAMRIWLDPSKMQKLGITMSDVTSAIKSQNVQAAAGTVGKNPTNGEQAFQYPIKIDGRLVTEQQFGNIVIKNSNGTVLHLKDIARIDVGAKGTILSLSLHIAIQMLHLVRFYLLNIVRLLVLPFLYKMMQML